MKTGHALWHFTLLSSFPHPLKYSHLQTAPPDLKEFPNPDLTILCKFYASSMQPQVLQTTAEFIFSLGEKQSIKVPISEILAKASKWRCVGM